MIPAMPFENRELTPVEQAHEAGYCEGFKDGLNFDDPEDDFDCDCESGCACEDGCSCEDGCAECEYNGSTCEKCADRDDVCDTCHDEEVWNAGYEAGLDCASEGWDSGFEAGLKHADKVAARRGVHAG